MNLTAMSYGEYVWPANPENIRVELARSTAEFRIPGGAGTVQNLGAAPRRVSGSGRFTGNGCMDEFRRLSSELAAGGSATLRLPGTEPFPAVFVSLIMKGGPRPNCVEYEFLFVEDVSSGALDAADTGTEPYVCAGGETLWDVANRYGTGVDALHAANPQIEWPDALSAGEKVTIA